MICHCARISQSSYVSAMPTALVTGASTGLGVEFARLFARDGIDLVITSTSRSTEELESVADDLRKSHSVDVFTISADLSEPAAAQQLYDDVAASGRTIDFLVNNAGYGILGVKLQDYDAQRFTRMLMLNVVALSELTALYAREMVKRGSGRILNVSSIAAYIIPHGLEAGYSASKAYVRSFSEAVSGDLRGTGVTCTHVAPGPTRTEFFDACELNDRSRLDAMMADAKSVAESGYRAMLAGRRSNIPGLLNKASRVGMALLPSKRLIEKISGAVIAPHHA